MRRALAAQTGLAVLLWFFAAPFFHLHAADTGSLRHDQEVGHDQDAIVHFHMPGHHAVGAGVELSAPDENEKPLDSFAIVQKHTLVLALPFLIATWMDAPQLAPDFLQRMVVPHTPRAHDPPSVAAIAPRAPPA